MSSIRPVVVALIAMAGVELLSLCIVDWFSAIFAILLFAVVYFYKKSPIFYIILSAILGIVLKL